MILKNFVYVKILFVLFYLSCNLTQAQEYPREFISADIGLGITIPNEDYDISGSGFYAQAEYIYAQNKWLSFRPYIAYINAPFDAEFSNQELVQQGFTISANALSLGGKVRLTAPIPYIAPFFELGIGASFGSFKTLTPVDDLEINGASLNLPVSIGLAIGKRKRFELGLYYFIHPQAQQITGGATVGLTLPLDVFED